MNRDVQFSARSFVSHLKEELVSEHVDGQLLVAEGVDAGGAAAGRRPDLERDRPHGLPHADEQPDEVLVRRRLGQELLLPHHTAPQTEPTACGSVSFFHSSHALNSIDLPTHAHNLY